jgi:hypothetical protein
LCVSATQVVALSDIDLGWGLFEKKGWTEVDVVIPNFVAGPFELSDSLVDIFFAFSLEMSKSASAENEKSSSKLNVADIKCFFGGRSG